MLREGKMLRGLSDYVALDAARRAHVKEQVHLAELPLLDETGIAGAVPEAKAAALGVMAMKRALAILDDDPHGALELLAQHWAVLHAIPGAVRAAGTAQYAIDIKQKILAVRRLAEGLNTVAADAPSPRENLARTQKILESVRREHLDDSERAFLDRTLGEVRRMGERIDRSMEVGKLRSKSEFGRARDVVDGLIKLEEALAPEEIAAGEEGMLAHWQRLRAEVISLLARSTGLRLGGPPGDEPGALLGLEAPRLLGVPASVLPGGEELLLVEVHQIRIFFQVVELASSRVVRRASFCLREEVPLLRIQQHAGLVALMGPKGLFEVDPRSWELHRAVGVGFAGQPADDVILAPGGRFVWLTCTTDKAWSTYTSSDADRADADYGRHHGGGGVRVAMQALPGLAEPRVLVLRDNGGTLAQHEPRGPLLPGGARPLWSLPLSFTVHPGGDGMVALLRDPDSDADDDDDDDDTPVATPTPPRAPALVSWGEIDLDGTPRPGTGGPARRLDHIDPDAPYQVATARDAGMVFILYTTLTGARRLLGLGLEGKDLAPRFAVDAPARLTLAQDAEARGVVALSPHEGGVTVVRLGASPPTLGAAVAAGGLPLGAWSANLVPAHPCAPWDVALWSMTHRDTGHRLPIEFLVHMRPEGMAGMIDKILGERSHLVPRYAVTLRLPVRDFAVELAARARARYPGDVEMTQLPATAAALEGDWETVRDLLSPLDPAPLSDTGAQHHDHLLGVALLMLGDAGEARRVLARGAARPGWCDLGVPLALLGLEGGPSPTPLYAVGRALDAAVRAADACLAAGDLRGARRALSPLPVREAREVQTLARLCKAWLEEPDRAAIDTFARRLALAAFCAAHAEKKPLLRRELPFPGATWAPAALDALAAQAHEMLDHERVATLKGEEP